MQAQRVHTKVYLTQCKTVKEIRRFNLSHDTTWAQLCERLEGLFGMEEYTIEYKDPEDDLVLLTSVEEWEECLRLGCNYGDVAQPLRLIVKRKGKGRCPNLQTFKQTLQSDHFYNPQGAVAEAQPLLDTLQELVPSIVARYVPQEWHKLDKLELPKWLEAAVNVFTNKSQEADLDVNINGLAAVLSAQALKAMDEQDFATALQMLQDAIGLQPTPERKFNLSCCYALMGSIPEALQALEDSVALGYNNYAHLIADDDLISLRGEERYQAVVAALNPSPAAASVAAQPTEFEEPQKPSAPSAPQVDATPTVREVDDDVKIEEIMEEKIAETKPVPFAQELQKLHQMGFWDDQASTELLNKHNGRLDNVIFALLS
eukprot:NODE_811_length_1321_cov_3299.849843_g616_i0.p1 GENE.NODE_811_length_1321_cov_3299.849843_g616_i0~~NODE_811_length_1321_cov_3299.849843_g616_i0.p1  ORF type:complete len:373 (-),score=83.14 NODE_811_length_1321_cov_3299.849843_g616_i0:127-1245(-)